MARAGGLFVAVFIFCCSILIVLAFVVTEWRPSGHGVPWKGLDVYVCATRESRPCRRSPDIHPGILSPLADDLQVVRAAKSFFFAWVAATQSQALVRTQKGQALTWISQVSRFFCTCHPFVLLPPPPSSIFASVVRYFSCPWCSLATEFTSRTFSRGIALAKSARSEASLCVYPFHNVP